MSITSTDITTEQFLFQYENGPIWSKQVLTLHHSDFGIEKLSIEMTTDGAGWAALKDLKLFQFRPEICGPVFGGGFNPSKPYLITVEMHSNNLTLLSILHDNASNLEDWITEPTVSNALQDSAQFLLISTMQSITPTIQWGMSTIYSQSHHQ